MRFAVANMCPRLMLLLLLSTSACITPSEKKTMKDDIFNAQTRLLNLERLLNDSSKEGKNNAESASKRLASSQAELERLGKELQEVHGSIDALKVGVTTGQMPGQEPAQQENSMAAQLAKIGERLAAVEQAQEELVEALKKAGMKSGKKKEAAKTSSGGIATLQDEFDQKKYKQVVEEAPKFMKAGATGDKETARFLLAESYFKLGKMREAALKYNDFLDSKPSKKYLPHAKMRMGDCFKELGDAGTSKVYYEELIKEYPDTDEAAKAKERLAAAKDSKSNGE